MSKIKNKAVTKTSSEINTGSKVNVSMKINNVSPKITIFKDKQTRAEIFQIISDNVHLSKTQVEQVFDELNKLIRGHLKKRGSGEFIIPKTGIKLRRIKKKASKERLMLSPLIGKEVTISAKPARLAVKLTALKFLKEMVEQQ